MDDKNTDRSSYWNEFYKKSRPTGSNPSQFAVFVHGELPGPARIFDIGCGSGRDAFFFASHGHHVTGVDAAESAVNACNTLIQEDSGHLDFVQANVRDLETVYSTLESSSPESQPSRGVLVYARFFIHAINEEEELLFLHAASHICKDNGWLAVEFRTERDAPQAKVTPTHYRRFVNPLTFINRASAVGFQVNYFVEGYGYAKYRQDDAYVARIILSKGLAE